MVSDSKSATSPCSDFDNCLNQFCVTQMKRIGTKCSNDDQASKNKPSIALAISEKLFSKVGSGFCICLYGFERDLLVVCCLLHRKFYLLLSDEELLLLDFQQTLSKVRGQTCFHMLIILRHE